MERRRLGGAKPWVRQRRHPPKPHLVRSDITASKSYVAFTNNRPFWDYPYVVPCRAKIVIRIELLFLYPNSAVRLVFNISAVDQSPKYAIIEIIRTND